MHPERPVHAMDSGYERFHTVPPGTASERLDRYATGVFPILASRKQAWKAARRGELRVNDEVSAPNRKVACGDLLSLRREAAERKVFGLKLQIIYEDDFLAVVHKPAGFAVSGNAFRTIEMALPGNLTQSRGEDALAWPQPVHRLDVPTTGLLLVAKRMRTLVALGRQFEEQRVQKRYRGIVTGRLEGRGFTDSPVEGRDARSEYVPVEYTPCLHTDWITTLDLLPKTGRTHQLRIHLAELGHPLAGDTLYGRPGKVYRSKGLFLAAVGLHFRHPETAEELDLRIAEPAKFESYRVRETRRWGRTRNGASGACRE